MKKISVPVRCWVIVIAVSVIPLLDLLHPGLPVTHDGQDHVARIVNFYQSLSEGNIVPRWAANLNWGYGHPILMFLYPLPSYMASFFHMVGFSFVDSTKLVFAVAFIGSTLAMYLWMSAAWGVWPAIVAAVLYGLAPYRFVDLYVRGAIGEHMAFVFLPVILWGLFTLKTKRAAVWGPFTIALGTAALILSHNALSIMFLPLIVLYAVYLSIDHEKHIGNFLLLCASSIGAGFLLSAFFWIPALLEGKYTLRDIVTAGQFDGRFVPWLWFIYSPWSYGGGDALTKSLGWAQLVVIVLSVVALFKRDKHRLLLFWVLGILFVSLFIMTQLSAPVWAHVTLLQKFQFPWRFLSVIVFAAAVLGGLVTAAANKRKVVIALCISAVAIIGTVNMWHARVYKIYPESFFTGIYHGTTDTGESSPIWSVRFMEHEPAMPMYLIDGDVHIVIRFRNTTSHVYDVIAKQPSRLVENTLYFPGWQVRVDGVPIPIQFQDPSYRGLMTFQVPQGPHRVQVVFIDTKLRKISNGISLGSFVLFIVVLGTMSLWLRKK